MTASLQEVLRYGTPTHDKIKKALISRYDASRAKMAKRHSAWTKAEDLYVSYVKETDADSKRRAKREAGTPQYTTVTVPYSYATLLTALTYWASVFLSRSPVMQFTGRHGESQQQVQALEAIIDYQVQVGQMLPSLYLWLLDAGKYGLGIVGDYWDEEVKYISTIEEVPVKFMGILPIAGKTEKKRTTKQILGYVGNKIYNVRPFDFFPDPRVTIANLQQGEFCGRRTFVNWNDIVRGCNSGRYIPENKEALRKRLEDCERDQGSSQVELPDSNADFALELSDRNRPGSVHLLEMVWDLVPKEWDLGEETSPQKWAFTLGQKEVVMGAQPLGLDHNTFPWRVLSYEVADYSYATKGMLEIIRPLNETLDWLFNSHMANVRQTLNGNYIVDPSRLVMKDFTSGPGRLLRLAPTAYGSDVRTVVTQLQTYDVTQGNIKDAQLVMEIIQRITGVSDNIMGMVYPGGRKTATEVRTSSSFGVNRLRTFSEYNSALGWSPLSQMLVQNTQQLYDQDMKFKLTGDLMAGAPKFAQINREAIQGFYDYVPVDGTLPIDRYAQANLWKEILVGMAQMPQIAMGYDIAGIFSWMAQLAGLKNITQYRLNIAPDAALAMEAQKGNMVPANGKLGSAIAGGPTPGEMGMGAAS